MKNVGKFTPSRGIFWGTLCSNLSLSLHSPYRRGSDSSFNFPFSSLGTCGPLSKKEGLKGFRVSVCPRRSCRASRPAPVRAVLAPPEGRRPKRLPTPCRVAAVPVVASAGGVVVNEFRLVYRFLRPLVQFFMPLPQEGFQQIQEGAATDQKQQLWYLSRALG